MPNHREIVILAYPQVQSLDVTGPLEVFTGAQQLANAGPGYRVTVVAPDDGPLPTSSSLLITPHAALQEAPSKIDTLIVAGGPGSVAVAEDRRVLDWLSANGPRTRRCASVCTGAFVLAACGLLDGRRATTHWAAAEELARRHPAVTVDPEPIFIRDGPIWTSAGVTAGMDLALAMVEQDLDREIALRIARHLVLFLRRPGSQSQFSVTLASQEPDREGLREIQRFILEHPQGDLSVGALAERAHMSPRHFARSFRRELGTTPARYVEQVRLESARRALEESVTPVAAVAEHCGFGSAESMRRTFIKSLGISPAEYRRRFHSTATSRLAA